MPLLVTAGYTLYTLYPSEPMLADSDQSTVAGLPASRLPVRAETASFLMSSAMTWPELVRVTAGSLALLS